MKYAFRRYATGPKAQMKDNWDLPLNLQACPKCKTLNHKMATRCSKCGHALSEPSKTAMQERIPHAGSPSSAIAGNASQAAPIPARPTPDILMANRQFAMSNEQKWLRRIWGVILLASVAIPLLMVVFSLQSPSAPPPATKNPSNNAGGSPVIAPPLASVPVAAEQKISPPVPEQALAATEPVNAPAATPVLAEPESPPPTLAKQNKQSAHAAPAQPAKFTDKKIARAARKSSRLHSGKAAPAASETPEAPIPRPREPVAPAKAPCSEAARALALCNAS